jgi:hypothetical protein
LNKLPLKRRVLIVGEGRETEYNYFVGFRNAFEEELRATATSVSVARGKGGDARAIVKKAIYEAKKFSPDPKRGDRVFLLLDTEGPGRASELPGAEKLAEKNGIQIVYSCPALEYWLLCHFRRISRGYFKDCSSVITALDKRWNSVCKTRYDKSDKDIFDRLSHLVQAAREEALAIDLYHTTSRGAARRVNPSSQVYELIAILIGARTGAKCPIAGTWTLIGDASITIRLEKGESMPTHRNNEVGWKL